MLEHARRHPRLVVDQTEVERVGDNVFRVRVVVRNAGTFPTHVTEKGKDLSIVKSGSISLTLGRNLELLSLSSLTDIGHLAGITGHRRFEWFVRLKSGKRGNATIVAHLPRAGRVQCCLKIG